MGRTRRASVLVASALSGSLLLASCGGGDDASADEPTDVSSASAAPTASATPTPTKTSRPAPEPLSRFEGDPAVKAARAWAAAAARSITAGQEDLARAKPYMTPNGQRVIPPLAADEIGLEYPGPVPFTPTSVDHAGSGATLQVCFWSAGFGLDRKTGQPAHAREVIPMQFAMVRQGGSWKIDAFYSSKSSCSKVPVKGVGF
jgi:hypothetical protein